MYSITGGGGGGHAKAKDTRKKKTLGDGVKKLPQKDCLMRFRWAIGGKDG